MKKVVLCLLTAAVLAAGCDFDDDVDGAGDPVDGGCGLPVEGCCEGTTLRFCEDGVAAEYDCTGYDPPVCGWDATNGWFDCAHDDALDADGGVSPDCP